MPRTERRVRRSAELAISQIPVWRHAKTRSRLRIGFWWNNSAAIIWCQPCGRRWAARAPLNGCQPFLKGRPDPRSPPASEPMETKTPGGFPCHRCKAAMLSNGILQFFLLSRTLNLLLAVVFYNRRSRQFLLRCWKPAATRPQVTQVTQGLKGKHYSAVTIELLLVL